MYALCKTYDNVSEGLRSLWQKAERRMAAACVNSTNYNTLTELHGDMVTVRPSATQNRIKEYDRLWNAFELISLFILSWWEE